MLTIDSDKIPEYTKNTLERFIVGPGAEIIGANLSKSDLHKLINKTVEYYVDRWNKSNDYRHYLKQYTYVCFSIYFYLVRDFGSGNESQKNENS